MAKLWADYAAAMDRGANEEAQRIKDLILSRINTGGKH